MTEASSNSLPANRAALPWLQEAKASPDGSVSYLAQLAAWGLDKNVVDVPRPQSPSQPERHNLESAVNALLGAKPDDASQWFLSNPNLAPDEQEASLVQQLGRAKSPQEAAQIVVQTAYDLMVAESASSPA